MFKKFLVSLAVAIFVIGAIPTIQVQAASGCTGTLQSGWNGTSTVRNNNTNLRAQSSTASASLGVVHAGARVAFTHLCVITNNVAGGSWLRVTIQSGAGSNNNAGRSGWIRADLIVGFG